MIEKHKAPDFTAEDISWVFLRLPPGTVIPVGEIMFPRQECREREFVDHDNRASNCINLQPWLAK